MGAWASARNPSLRSGQVVEGPVRSKAERSYICSRLETLSGEQRVRL